MSYSDLVLSVSEILGNYDPEHVILGGIPLNEYESEAEAIAVYMICKKNVMNVNSLASYIQETFRSQTGHLYPIQKCLRMAVDIMNQTN